MEYKLKDYYSVPKVRWKLPKDVECGYRRKRSWKKKKEAHVQTSATMCYSWSNKYAYVMGHRIPSAWSGENGAVEQVGQDFTEEVMLTWDGATEHARKRRARIKVQGHGLMTFSERIPSNLIWLEVKDLRMRLAVRSQACCHWTEAGILDGQEWGASERRFEREVTDLNFRTQNILTAAEKMVWNKGKEFFLWLRQQVIIC